MNKHFAHFLGKEVMVSTDILVQDSTATEMGMQTNSYPLFYEGILIDVDDEYFYLGENYDTPTHILAKRKFVHMMQKPMIDLNAELLKQMETPDNPEEIN